MYAGSGVYGRPIRIVTLVFQSDASECAWCRARYPLSARSRPVVVKYATQRLSGTFERRVLKRAVIAYERGVVCLCLHVKSAVCEKSAEK